MFKLDPTYDSFFFVPLQSLAPPVYVLMKATEPWSDDYDKMDLEGAIEEAGFKHVTSKLTDPRHWTVTGTA